MLFDRDHPKPRYKMKDVDWLLEILVMITEEQKLMQEELDKILVGFSADSLGL